MSSNTNIPNEYGAPPKAPNFTAPAHSFLSGEQAEQIVKVAEGSHRDTSGGASTVGTLGSTGFGSSNIGGAHQSGLTSGDRSIGEGPAGAYSSNDQYNQSGRTGAGLGAGAAGLGAAGAGAAAYGSSGHGSGSGQQDIVAKESSADRRSDGTLDTTPNKGSGAVASHGSLEHKLQQELERNAVKKGTHAAGFGTAGMSSDTGLLHSSHTGISDRGAGGGYTQGGQSSSTTGVTSGLTSGLTGTHGTGSGLTGASTGTGLGHHGQGQGQGLENRLVGEVENRAHGVGSDNVTGLGSAGVNAQHGSSSSVGRAL